MTNKAKKEQIKEKISEYFDIKKTIFHNRNNENKAKENNNQKHSKINEMADLLNNRELEIIIPKFQKIINDQVEGCEQKKMLVYLTTGSKKYLECLDGQKDAAFNLIDTETDPLTIIIGSDGNIIYEVQ